MYLNVFSAVYTNMAFLNHSCNSNTIKYFDGAKVSLVWHLKILSVASEEIVLAAHASEQDYKAKYVI